MKTSRSLQTSGPGRIILSLIVGLGLALITSASAWSPGTGTPDAIDGFVVDREDRTDVLAFHNTVYRASENSADHMNWTGNVAGGVAGTTSADFKDDVLRRINYYRAMAGLPADIVFDDVKSAKAQAAALMFSANNEIRHDPPADWAHYSADGAEGAFFSNIGLGVFGPEAVDAYMVDDGDPNISVGHRRWFLYSQAQEMGTGDVPPAGVYGQEGFLFSASAIWVIGDFKAAPDPEFVPYPGHGFFPEPLNPARWSLSYPGANFSGASVSMQVGGVNIPVGIISRSSINLNDKLGDNTIVWEMGNLPSASTEDVEISVLVSGITGTNVPTSHAYTVTLFNPTRLGDEVVIEGPDFPPSSGSNYAFTPLSQVDAYELRVSKASSEAWMEGAEDDTQTFVEKTPVSIYEFRQSVIKRSGQKAFHLALPDFTDQSIVLLREIIPSTTSSLNFYDLGRFATTTTTLHAEVSEDQGDTWTSIWSRKGAGLSLNLGNTTFISRSVSLAAYSGRSIQIRFIVRHNNLSIASLDDKFPITAYGFIIDDISVSNATVLTQTTTTVLPGDASTFPFNATTAGGDLEPFEVYMLRVRPQVGTRWFSDGPVKTVTASLPVIDSPEDFLPQVKPNYPVLQVAPGTVPFALDPSYYFALPEVEGPMVKVSTSLGDFHMELLPVEAPATVANFQEYMQDGSYTNALIHRSVPGFIVQTGGFQANAGLDPIPANPAVVNEFKLSNTRGTVAMAKLGGDPNSATNQWFVNLADNSANLDFQNGGFTVFARVLGTGMTVWDAIAALPIFDLGPPFNEIPLEGVTDDQDVLYISNLVSVESVEEVPNGSLPLELSVVNNTKPTLVKTSITDGGVVISNVRGAAQITVRATDVNGNFVDSVLEVKNAPSALTFLSPASNAKLTTSSASFSGRAQSTTGIPVVEFSTNGGLWWIAAQVSGSSSPFTWTADVPLTPGANTVLFRSRTPLDAVHSMNSRAVHRHLPGTVEVILPPVVSGTVVGGFRAENTRLVGYNYTITARAKTGTTIAKPGTIFRQWLANGVPVSSNARYTFTMEDGLVLEPEFIDNPYPHVAGIYNGVFGDLPTGVDTEETRNEFFLGNGILTVTAMGNGRFTGNVRLEGARHAFSGMFDGFGEATVNIRRARNTDLQLTLEFDTVAPGEIQGTLVSGDLEIPISMLRGTFSGRRPDFHPLNATRHNVILRLPSGEFGRGYASFRISANGTATVAGKLADGTVFTSSSRVVTANVEDWLIPVYVPRYLQSKGMVWGELLIDVSASGSPEEVVGGIEWLRPANSKAPIYPAGLFESLTPRGTRYTVPKNISLLSGTNVPAPFSLVLDTESQVLGGTEEIDGVWPEKNNPSLEKPAPLKTTLSFAPATGIYRGTFHRPISAGKTAVTRYEGIVITNPIELPGEAPIFGAGYLTTGTQVSGVLIIAP